MLKTALIGGALLFAAAFPTQTARAYLAATAPRTDADGVPQPLPTTLPAAAQSGASELRRLTDSTDRATRALAHFVLGQAAVNLDLPDEAKSELVAAMDYAPIRDAAAATLIPLLARHSDAAGVLDAAVRSGLAGMEGDPKLTAADPFFAAVAAPAAQAAMQLNRWQDVLEWSAALPSTAGVLWMRAQAYAATGSPRQAAELERNLEYHFPASTQAAAAASAWQAALDTYPDLAPDWQLTAARAQAWSLAGRARDAEAAWRAAIALAPAASRDTLSASLARVEVGAGDRNAADDLALLLPTGQRAQGLELQVELARRSDDLDAEQQALDRLRAEFPTDAWYARALHEAGDQALLDNDPDRIERDFDALVAGFPDSAYAATSAWQAAWAADRTGADSTPRRLEAYLTRYPNGGEAVDALFWRGVWAASHGDPDLARACFDAAVARYPETFFGLQARLARAALPPAMAPATLSAVGPPAFLHAFPSPAAAAVPAAPAAAAADAATRAALFESAGLLDPAAMLFDQALLARPVGAVSLPAARALADLDAERGDWRGAIVAMEHAVPNALRLDRDALSVADWKRLYPRPWADLIPRLAAQHGLDVDFVYGLIRQESAFDPGSISSAQARGLMQLELGTARPHVAALPPAWKMWLGGAPLDGANLLVPGLNLALGTAELGTLRDRFGQPWYAAAGYDAGASRVEAWRAAYPTTDADVFIESIPFIETRNYVQAVLRNQAMYQYLYGDGQR